jgi:hypothetical protein
MQNRLFKKLRCLRYPIELRKQRSVFPDWSRVDLVIIRRDDSGRPLHTVWLYGNISLRLFYLFDIVGATMKLTKLGQKYGAELTATSYVIRITQPFPLRQLCRDLRIRRVIVVRSKLPIL